MASTNHIFDNNNKRYFSMTEYNEAEEFMEDFKEQDENTQPAYIPVKIRLNENEYTYIKNLVGDKTVSGAMRDLFLTGYNFKYNDMPRIDAKLRNEIIRCQKFVGNINKNLQSLNGMDYIKAVQVLNLTGSIYREIGKVFDNNSRKEMSDEEIERASWQQQKRWLKKKSFIETERRTKEIKIYFNDIDYHLASSKAERRGQKLATAIREHFIGQSEFIINSVPKVHPSTYLRMMKVGDALSYIDEGFGNEVKSGMEVDLDELIKVLNALLSQGLLPITRIKKGE